MAGLESLRRSFVELAMMETSVGRVAQLVRPLAEISNLSNLSEADLRAAARSILERRVTRISQANSGLVTRRLNDDSEDLVPLPPEVRDQQ